MKVKNITNDESEKENLGVILCGKIIHLFKFASCEAYQKLETI